MPFCVHCGSYTDVAVFCPNCGARIVRDRDLGLAAVIDVETTGLSHRDEIIELSVALVEYRRDSGEIVRTLDEYSGLREPNCSISRSAQNVHGISKRSLRGLRIDEGRVVQLVKQAEFVVAHNAEFDRRFVESYLPHLGATTWRCSLKGVDWQSYGFDSARLPDLLRHHGKAAENAHRAAGDVASLIELLATRSTSGRTYFSDLLHSEPLEAPRKRKPSSTGPTPAVTKRQPSGCGCLGVLATAAVVLAITIGCALML